MLKILLVITYVKKFAKLCPEVRPYEQTAIQNQLMHGNLHNQITCGLDKIFALV